MAPNDDVTVGFGAKIEGLISGVEAVKAKLESISGTAEGVVEAFTGVGEAIATVFAVEKIDQFVTKIGDLGLQVERTARQLGVATQEVSLLNYAAETNDVSTSQMRNSLERLTTGLEAATKGGNRQAAALAEMGINAKEFIANGGTMEQLVNKMSAATAELAPHTNLAGVYIALMGRSGADAIPVFQALGEHMEELRQKTADAGMSFSPEFTERIATTRQSQKDLDQSTQGLGASIFSILKPAIDGAILIFRDFMQVMIDSATKGGVLQGALVILTGVFLTLETAIIEVMNFVEQLFSGLTMWIDIATIKMSSFVSAVKTMATEGTDAAAKIWQSGNAQIAAKWDEHNASIVAKDKALTEKLSKMWGDYKNQIGNFLTGTGAGNRDTSSGGKASVIPGLDTGESDVAKAKRLMEEDIANHKAMLDLELQQAGTNLAQKKLLWENYFNWLKNKYPQDVKAQLEAAAQIQRITNEEVTKLEQKWGQFFGSFNSSIMGMLKGTTSWRQTMQNAMIGVAEFWLKNMEKMAAHWIATEAIKTSATQAGNTARVISDKAAAAASGGFSTSTAIKTITGDAAKAYAGTYGFLAPEMGPFAAIPAAVAFAAVMGMEALVPSFAVGTWNVPHDMMAQLHAGERVLTAHENERYSKGGGSGGVTLVIQGGINDAKGIRNMLMREGGSIMKSISRQAQQSHTHIPGVKNS